MHFANYTLQFVFFACIIKIIVYFIIIRHQPQQIAILQIARSATYAHPHTPLPCTSLRSPSPSSPRCFPPHVTPRNAPFIYGGATGREIFIRKNGFFHRGYPFFFENRNRKKFFPENFENFKTDLVFFYGVYSIY